ncbi:hypothetical protein, partial [Delftia sp. CH05]|uniref:hypothetical protein n=1 Tax=Delftia sp. CH05 TaxID=2692194 RepID=UPI001F18CA1B
VSVSRWLLAWGGVLFLTLPGGCFSRPGLGPAADLLSFVSPPVRRPKESRQSKGDPDVRDPFASLRGNLRRGGCGVRRETHFALRATFKHHGESDHEASLSFGRLATPQPPRRRR